MRKMRGLSAAVSAIVFSLVGLEALAETPGAQLFAQASDAAESGSSAPASELEKAQPSTAFEMAARAHGMDIVGRWAVQRDVSPIDDTPTFVALNYSLEAEKSGKIAGAPLPMLILKCADEERSLAMAPGEVIPGENGWVDVVYRVDSDPAVKTSWPMTPDQRMAGLVSRERIEPFIHELSNGEKLFLQLTDAAGRTHRYNFMLAGLTDLQEDLTDACDWLPKEEAEARKAAELARLRDPDRVMKVQAALKEIGMYFGEVNGDATNRFYRPGIMMFQLEFGLKPTGEADDATYKLLVRRF